MRTPLPFPAISLVIYCCAAICNALTAEDLASPLAIAVAVSHGSRALLALSLTLASVTETTGTQPGASALQQQLLEAALGILLTDNRHQSSESIANCTQLVLVTPSELFRRANALIKLNREWFDKTLALYPADMRVVALVGGLRSRLSTCRV